MKVKLKETIAEILQALMLKESSNLTTAWNNAHLFVIVVAKTSVNSGMDASISMVIPKATSWMSPSKVTAMQAGDSYNGSSFWHLQVNFNSSFQPSMATLYIGAAAVSGAVYKYYYL